MALDPTKFIIAPNLQEFVIDKTTGLPLSDGYIVFYSDANRTTLKAVYELTGYPDYTYTELPNPLPLSSVGTSIDESGNDIRIYYNPFDGDGNVELYYLEVYSSDDVLQFTREAWPNFYQTNPTPITQNAKNFVPNGQFLAHLDVQGDPNNNIPFGQIQNATTIIAPGGWTFERPEGSTAIDNITFFRYGQYVANPDASPRYAVEVNCNGLSISDTFKNLCLKFKDVNKFASDTDYYTFAFNGESNAGSVPVSLYLIKNYGTGGSPSAADIILLTQFTITTSAQFFYYGFTFGDNTGKGIGDNNDDYVQLAIGYPLDQTYSLLFTDFILTPGNVIVDSFPVQTNANMLANGIMGWLESTPSDGSDLYLPIVRTPNGVDVSTSQIGKVYASSSLTLENDELDCDGMGYPVDGYSNVGIPYRRVWNKIGLPNNIGISQFGTGRNFVTVNPFITTTINNASLTIVTNQAGAQTNTADGTTPTGFTFYSNVCNGVANFGFNAYVTATTNPTGWIFNTVGGYVDPNTYTIDAGTTPFTVFVFRRGQANTPDPNSPVKQIVKLIITTTPSAGQYFNIATTTQQYYVWYTVDGAGSDPAPGGTGIVVHLRSTFDNQTIIRATCAALSGFQMSPLQTTAGSAITNGSYWSFHANSQLFYVWYSLNNTGSDPALSGGTGIKVIYSSSDANTDIGFKTMYAINSKYMATPDLRGVFIRGLDDEDNPVFDLGIHVRYGTNYVDGDNKIGTLQFDEIYSHAHEINVSSGGLGTSKFVQELETIPPPGNLSTLTEGSSESRPVNMAFKYVIKH